MVKKLFTSESVTEGHPDKLCDKISDAILDEYLKQDPYARVACETLATKNTLIISGEITASCTIDIEKIARETIAEIGYTNTQFGFDSNTCDIKIYISKQSPDIALGVDAGKNKSLGAGDQGIVYGYACDETKELMPMPIVLAHNLAKRLAEVRKNNILDFLGPDGKTQVTVEYINNKPLSIDTILISTQHKENISIDYLKKNILEFVVKPIIPYHLINSKTKILVNPTGKFVYGGPFADTGLTGRKIIVDTYGGYSRHGGGAFSGKDPSKVDRSAAYAARYIAKNIVASGLAKKCELQIGYAIGLSEPISIYVNTFNTGQLADNKISNIVKKEFDLSPQAIIKKLDLQKPIFKQTSAYGHFGRNDLNLTWEETDKIEDLKKYLIDSNR